MYNSRLSFYKTPFGAVPVGERVIFRVIPPEELPDPRPVLEIFPIGQGDNPSAVTRIEMRGQPAPGEKTSYSCAYLPAEAGVYQYRFCIQGNLGEFFLLRQPDSSAGVNEGGLWQLTVYEPFTVPKEMEGAIFYQIFPDRFCNSGAPKGDLPAGRVLHQDWDEAPVDRPDENGQFLCNDYFGGDLAGIRRKLPYLVSLGVEVIYLNPIFEAHANHRYNTADYKKIDPLLGNEEDFQLCLGFAGPEAGGKDLAAKIDSFKGMVSEVKAKYGNSQIFATTLRQVLSANEHLWGALMLADGEWIVEEPRPIPVLDRIGGGDGFTGGVLYGVLNGWEPEKCLQFGWASGVLAASSLNDYAEPADEKQIWDIYAGNARVQR